MIVANDFNIRCQVGWVGSGTLKNIKPLPRLEYFDTASIGYDVAVLHDRRESYKAEEIWETQRYY